VSGVNQFAHSLEAGKLGSQDAGNDEVFEPSSIQAFQPSSHFTETYTGPEALNLSGGSFVFFNYGWSDGLRYDCLLGLLENAVKTGGRAGARLASDVGK
jgi:hypothetical protein